MSCPADASSVVVQVRPAANVAAAHPDPVSRIIADCPALALLLAVSSCPASSKIAKSRNAALPAPQNRRSPPTRASQIRP